MMAEAFAPMPVVLRGADGTEAGSAVVEALGPAPTMFEAVIVIV